MPVLDCNYLSIATRSARRYTQVVETRHFGMNAGIRAPVRAHSQCGGSPRRGKP